MSIQRLNQQFGSPRKTFITLDQPLGPVLPIHRKMTQPFQPAIEDRNGMTHECLAEAFTDPRRDLPSDLAAVRSSMRRQVGQLLRERLGVEIKKSGGRRPLWKLLPALEIARELRMPESDLPKWHELKGHWRNAASGQAEAIPGALSQWSEAADNGLGTVTQGEVAALAEFALSGPGVVLGRALIWSYPVKY